MRHFKTLILGCAISLAFAACGEGFKANHTLNDSAADITPPAPASETPAAVHEAIARENGFEPQSSTQNRELQRELGAFEITTEVVSHPGGGSEALRSISASYMGTSCNSEDVTLENTNITMDQLQSRTDIGVNDQYRIDARCSKDDCSEMVATVRRSATNFSNRPVLFALSATNVEHEGRTTRTTYTSTRSEVRGYSTIMSMQQKFNSCMQGPVRPEIVDPTGADLDGDFIELPTPDENNSFFFPTTTAI